MKYTESQLEQAFISLLETEGYRYINGKELTRTSNQEVLIKDDLRTFLLNRYPDLEEMELESIINEIAFQSASNLYESNKYICKLLDRKSTRLNSSHVRISYAVFCLKKKKKKKKDKKHTE